jgi:membrane-associated phospholipid phosphatase
MHWLQTLDLDLFRFVNLTLSNSALDIAMPWASGNAAFIPALLLLGILLVWKGGTRGLICVLMLVVAVSLTDGICNIIKHAVARPRPFLVLAEAHLPPTIGRGGSGSMPSSHAANWFAGVFVAFIYYRRSLWFVLPAALVVSFSRVYNGVHYPSDVLAGAILGAGCAAAVIWVLENCWQCVGRKWFPLWWESTPSLVCLPQRAAAEEGPREDAPLDQALPRTPGRAPAGFRAPHTALDAHWLRLGYLCIVLLLVARWLYLASGTIQLAEDEAYQWVWSKHLALSYYSKPPLIAYTQFLSTSLLGDNAFGVRFLSPLITALLSWIILRFFAREVNARAGFFLLLIVTATPLLSVGAVLMTVDPLSVLFWTAAMLAAWRAVQERGTTGDWFRVGLWLGLGFLSKYTALLQWLCLALFLVLWPPGRKHLRQAGPYLALLTNLICALPVLIWNFHHRWITVTHVAGLAGAGEPWHPTFRFLDDFIGGEFGLLNPIFFVASFWAACAFWRRGRHDPRLLYFFSMGAPVFLVYLVQSFRTRILPNWIVPGVLPWFCLMVIYWEARWRLGVRQVKGWLNTGLILGFVIVILFHQTNLWSKTFGVRQVLASALHLLPAGRNSHLVADLLTEPYLPVHLDPLHRVREWDTTARVVNQARLDLQVDGQPVFIIADHYGLVGQISFYLPEARAAIKATPLVYCRSSPAPENQFYFWPGYNQRKGQNAIYVRELNRDDPAPLGPPTQLKAEFKSVKELGVTNVLYHDKFLLRPLQLFECQGLK